MVKICPKCGRKYQEDDNFCSQHSDELIKLVNIDDLVKRCESCGALYPKEYKYCIRCNSEDELVNIIKTPEIKYIKTKPNQFYNFKDYTNQFSEITDLLSPKNVSKLNNFEFSQEQFSDILDKIKKTYRKILNDLVDEYSIDINSLKTLDKILLFSKSFVKTEYKEGGGDLGHFEFNEIYIDDRATDALQITTIIHELSHFLLAEILEQVVSYILNTDKTDAVEAFICYTLIKDDFNYLVDEYCAHTVEGRFAVLGYQDYGSYKSILKRFLEIYSEDYIDVAKGIGNTFAYYIKDIITSFIDDKLRDDIKDEFSKINDQPEYSELQFETSEVYDWNRFSTAMKLILTRNIEDFSTNPQDIEELKMYAVKFKKNNY